MEMPKVVINITLVKLKKVFFIGYLSSPFKIGLITTPPPKPVKAVHKPVKRPVRPKYFLSNWSFSTTSFGR
ncbi:MAG: hypothetical protein IPJ22_11280 [Bacteroidetes bacterium]|nr:hypothetical protein [Bacteroidota bacterium]